MSRFITFSLGRLAAVCVMLLAACSSNPAPDAQPLDLSPSVYGTITRMDVSGEVVKIDDTIPLDGGVLIMSVRADNGTVSEIHFRGATQVYKPTPEETRLLAGARNVRVGDVIEAQINNGYVSAFRLYERMEKWEY